MSEPYLFVVIPVVRALQSNCINSGISKIYILTQFNSTSLNRHWARAYNMGSGVRFGGEGFVEVLAATQTPTDGTWFQGTADAVRQYTWLLSDIKNRVIEDVVILSGDHLYRMDYMKFVDYHRDMNADITVGCIPNSADRAKEFGLMKIDDKRRIIVRGEWWCHGGNIKAYEHHTQGCVINLIRLHHVLHGFSPPKCRRSPISRHHFYTTM
jgi:NDP-sugar pyrophosphorylase family protein